MNDVPWWVWMFLGWWLPRIARDVAAIVRIKRERRVWKQRQGVKRVSIWVTDEDATRLATGGVCRASSGDGSEAPR